MPAVYDLSYNATCVIISQMGNITGIYAKTSVHFKISTYDNANGSFTLLNVVHSITGNVLFSISDDPNSSFFRGFFNGVTGDMVVIMADITDNFYAT